MLSDPSLFQAVCERLPAAAAEVMEGVMQPCALGPGVYGADANCGLLCHVSSVHRLECPIVGK